jgi:DNA-binding NarL/FixJ family response regulator
MVSCPGRRYATIVAHNPRRRIAFGGAVLAVRCGRIPTRVGRLDGDHPGAPMRERDRSQPLDAGQPGPATRTTVLVAHHEALLRDLLRTLVESSPGYLLSGVARDWAETAELARRAPPDVVLLAGGLPGQSTVRTVRALTDVHPSHPSCVVVVDDTAVVDQVLDALHAGARGYVTTREGTEEILSAIDAVRRGEVRVPPELHSAILGGALDRLANILSFSRTVWSLSARERQVLSLVAAGASTESIAEELDISAETARTHVYRILSKLGVHSRLEAAAMVQSTGLLEALGDKLPESRDPR